MSFLSFLLDSITLSHITLAREMACGKYRNTDCTENCQYLIVAPISFFRKQRPYGGNFADGHSSLVSSLGSTNKDCICGSGRAILTQYKMPGIPVSTRDAGSHQVYPMPNSSGRSSKNPCYSRQHCEEADRVGGPKTGWIC